MRITQASKLAEWMKEKGLVSKKDLMQYGIDHYYLRAWRTCCDFVVSGKARKLSEAECEARGLTTSMAWYIYLSEPQDLPQEEIIKENNLTLETHTNTQFLERGRQLQFIT